MASNERPYGLICTNGCNTTLGHNMFFTLQTCFPTIIFNFPFSILHLIKTVCTNWERRLAVRASNERPYRLICKNGCNTTLGHNMFFTLQTCFPTIIFNFPFSILHLIKTVCTNWERRLAVRASNERPYGFICKDYRTA